MAWTWDDQLIYLAVEQEKIQDQFPQVQDEDRDRPLRDRSAIARDGQRDVRRGVSAVISQPQQITSNYDMCRK